MESLGGPSGYKGPGVGSVSRSESVRRLMQCGHQYHFHCLVAMYNNGNKDGRWLRDRGHYYTFSLLIWAFSYLFIGQTRCIVLSVLAHMQIFNNCPQEALRSNSSWCLSSVCSVPHVKQYTVLRQATSRQERWSTTSSLILYQGILKAKLFASSII